MKRINATPALAFLALFTVIVGCQPTQSSEEDQVQATPSPTYETTGSIDALAPEIRNILAADAKIEMLADSFTWSEGPLWLPAQEMLIFSDVPENKIYSWNETDGLGIYLKPSGYTGATPRGGEPGSNGLLLSPEGQLVLCQHGDRRMAVMEAELHDPAPNFRTLIRTYQDKLFNSPNDAAFDQAGNLYFTDPPYGLEQRMADPKKEIDFQGVYRLDPMGDVILLTDELSRPNGIALSPDEKTLYVANSDPERAIWMAYPINEDGTLGTGKVFYDATSLVGKEPGLPDGMKVAPNGTVFATGPGGVWVFSPAGTPIGLIRTGQPTANCAFDDTHKYLYMTANMFLMRVPLIASGLE